MAYDLNGALEAGVPLSKINDYLGKKYNYDLAGARKNSVSESDILDHLLSKEKPTKNLDDQSDLGAGFKTAFKQIPQLGYGLIAGAGAVAETALGEGGVSTGVKEYGLKKYQESSQDIDKYQKDVYDFNVALDKAKGGDIGAMADWLQYGLGYGAGQVIQAAVTGGVGSVVGKAALSSATKSVLAQTVEKQAAKIAAAELGAGATAEAIAQTAATDVVRNAAARNVASSIGAGMALGAQNVGMEGGEIFGDLATNAAKEGRVLDGDEIARAFGATIGAAGVETAVDMLGLGALTGKIKIGGTGGLASRAAIGGTVGATAEFGTEYLQTGIEQYGKGEDVFTDQAHRERLAAGALGAVGGGGIGSIGGALSSSKQRDVGTTDVMGSPSVDMAIDNAVRAADLDLKTSLVPELASDIDAYNAASLRSPALNPSESLELAAAKGAMDRVGSLDLSQPAPIAAPASAVTEAGDVAAREVEAAGGVATPAQAAMLDRAFPGQKMYDQVVGSSEQVPTVGNQSPIITDNGRAPRETVRFDNPLQAENSEAWDRYNANRAQAAAAPTVTTPDQSNITNVINVGNVIEALKTPPGLQSAEQRITLNAARQNLPTDDFQLLEAAAVNRGNLSAEQQIRLRFIEKQASFQQPTQTPGSQENAAKLSTDREQSAEQATELPAAELIYSPTAMGEGYRLVGTQQNNGQTMYIYADRNAPQTVTPNLAPNSTQSAVPEMGTFVPNMGTTSAAGTVSPKSGIATLEATVSNNDQVGTTGTVSSEGKTYNFNVVDSGAAPGVSGAIQQFARLFGKKAVFFTSDLAADGFVQPGKDSAIYINANSKMSPLAVFGHELMHLLKRDNPIAYKAVAAVVGRNLKGDAASKFRDYYNAEGPNQNNELTDAELEEMVADLMGNEFTQESFLSDVFNEIGQMAPEGQARSIILRLAATINKAIKAALNVIKGMPVSQAFDTDQMVNNLEEIRAALKSALKTYAVQQKESAAKMAMEFTREEAKVQLSPTRDKLTSQGAENATENDTGRIPSVQQNPGENRPGSVGYGRDQNDQIPSFGTDGGRAGSIRVQGVHYSKGQLSQVDGNFYGSNVSRHNGAEAERVRLARDRRITKRGYFYINTGNGIKPEANVGSVPHTAYLNNLYDTATGLITAADENSFESAVLDAGFDGFINRSAGMAVVLDNKQVPVVPSDGTAEVVPNSKEASVRGELSKLKTLPSGELTRERWGQVLKATRPDLHAKIEPSGAFNGDEKVYKDQLVKFSPARNATTVSSANVEEVAKLENAFDKARNGTFNTNRSLKEFLQNLVIGAAGKKALSRSKDYLVKVGATDALYALKSNANAVGWYDKKVSEALRVLATIHPELATDENARFVFTWALAVTSNGLKVDKNFELAEYVYNQYKQSGNMPTDIQAGQAQEAINENLQLFNELAAEWGIDNLRKFMVTEFTVAQVGRLTGKKPGGEFAETTVRGAAILGPKIGNGFFSNLYGYFDQLTMDRWLMRTWGRWTGTLIEVRDDMVKAKRSELKELVRKMREDKNATREFEKALGSKLALSDMDGLALAIQKASMKPELRKLFNKTDTGEEIRKTGNALAKYLDGQKEAPAGPEERNFIREVFAEILQSVRNQGFDGLTMADLQALLWYPEKRLYDVAKASETEEGYADDEAPDYANAAAKLARANGVSEQEIQDAANGRTAGTRPGKLEATAQDSAEGGARGFTGEERKDFLISRIIRSYRTGDGGPSRAYKRRSGTDGKRLRVLGQNAVAQYTAETKFKNAIGYADLPAQKMFELDSDGAGLFRDAIQTAKDSTQFGAAVYVYDESDYAGMRLFINEKGNSGFAIKGNDIVSVFSGEKGSASAMLQLAVDEGGQRLDAFNTVLPALYAANGFKSVAKLGWNDEYRPVDWNKATFAKYNNGEPDVVFMVFDPKNANRKTDNEVSDYDAGIEAQQAAIGDQPSDKPESNVKLSKPRFYSQLERTIEQVPARLQTQPAAQWKAWLASNSAKFGIKKDEIEWSGINDYLAMRGKEKVTAEEIGQFLDLNNVKIEEVTKGGPAAIDYSAVDELPVPEGLTVQLGTTGYRFEVIDTEDEAVVGVGKTEQDALSDAYSAAPEYWNALNEADGTKYGTWTLPGGSNYREMLLTLPERLDVVPNGWSIRDQGADANSQQRYVALDEDGNVRSYAPDQATAIERASKFAQRNTGSAPTSYNSSHWDEPNILAHIRINDRTNAKGNKVLFVEEIQSDWAQAGRKGGFRGELSAEDRARVSELRGQRIALDRKWRESENPIERRALMEQANQISNKVEEIESPARGAVPAAPFMANTKDWVSLAVKRVMLLAAQGNYDKVAFVNGKQSADRYNLAKQIDYIEYDKTGENDYFVKAIDKTGRAAVTEYKQTPADLENLLGKEIAQKIVNNEGTRDVGEPSSYGMLKNADLSVGGEGMKSFYDRIVPQVVGDVLKKLGGLVESVTISNDPNAELDQWVPEDGAGDGSKAALEQSGQLGFAVTAEMREKLQGEGLPLFSKQRGTAVQSTETYNPKDEQDGRDGFWGRIDAGDSFSVDELASAYAGDLNRRVDAKHLGGAGGESAFEWQGTVAGFKGYYTLAGNDPDGAFTMLVIPKSLLPEFKGLTADVLADKTILAVVGVVDKNGNIEGSVSEANPGSSAYKALQGAGMVELLNNKTPNGSHQYSKVSIGTGQSRKFIREFVRRYAVENGGIGNVRFTRDTGANVGRSFEYSPSQIKARFSPSRQSVADALAGQEFKHDLLNQTKFKLADIIAPGNGFNWFHKTVGTQFHKAKVNPLFKKVFDLGQQFLDDVTLFATRAEDKAADIFPRFGLSKSLLKTGLSKADNQLIGRALAEGTLENGPNPHDGVVWSDEELRTKYGMDDKQIGYYRQARAALDQSLDDLAKSEMATHMRIAMKANITPLIRADLSLQQVRDMLVQALETGIATTNNADATRMLEKTKSQINGIYSTTTNLKNHGYAPLMRFGEHTVTAYDENGEVAFFQMTDTKSEASLMAKNLGDQFARVETGKMSAEAHKLFKGVTPDTLELFAKHSALDTDALTQEYLQLAVSSRSAMKRLINRKGTTGYSLDATRTMATFLTSNARKSSSALNMSDMKQAADSIPRDDGDIKDEAVKLVEYLQNPGEEAAKLRGFLFFQYLGGSIASGIVNLTQPIMMTYPYLSQFGAGKAGAAMKTGTVAATHFLRGKKVGDPILQAAMEKAKAEGLIDPQEIYQLMAASQSGAGSFMSYKLMRLWGINFGVTELMNRAVTFAAAFKIGQTLSKEDLQKAGATDAYSFAQNTIYETQGLYNKGNRPDWARGAVGGTVFTFKQYSISYLEFMTRLYKNDKKAFGIAVAILIMAAGLQGLPGADDLDDVIDTAGNWMGYATNTKKWKREFLEDILGEDMAAFAMHGVSTLPGMPIDVQARLGLGNIIPGTGLLNPTRKDKGREVAEVFGVAGGLAMSTLDTTEAMARGDVRRAAMSILPGAVRNLVQAGEMAETGEYRDTRGRLVQKVDGSDVVAKAIGFQPRQIAEGNRRMREVQADIDIVKTKQEEANGKYARAIVDKDQEAMSEVREEIRDWNQKNPDLRIKFNMSAIQQRVKQARLTKEARFIKSAPQQMRQQVRSAVLD